MLKHNAINQHKYIKAELYQAIMYLYLSIITI